jgi:hypothetical protein
MDLCDLPHGGYFGTVIDEAMRFADVTLLARESDAPTAVRHSIMGYETQTDLWVQRVRHDRGGEYMGGELLCFYKERGIQREPTISNTIHKCQLTTRYMIPCKVVNDVNVLDPLPFLSVLAQ